MTDALVIFTPSGKRGRFPLGTPVRADLLKGKQLLLGGIAQLQHAGVMVGVVQQAGCGFFHLGHQFHLSMRSPRAGAATAVI